MSMDHVYKLDVPEYQIQFVEPRLGLVQSPRSWHVPKSIHCREAKYVPGLMPVQQQEPGMQSTLRQTVFGSMQVYREQ